ncbi:vitamin K epoxide reductase family protein [Streptomyces chumphonensis]|uniref:Vitamin K epoxide reductase family protein n=1 Tax=Streptomyces chumphonensis TaxID=1214925 RepID=A0A927EXV1_9ACTN|nr:vitamin K epoxide reductase family protein [Streptomyces chumphonensis]MBD3931668.1 vitamin K epoxide reductase family protein [Streptomyces chumphonensis]
MTQTAPPAEDGTDDERPGPATIAAGRVYAWLLVVTGLAGLLAAWVITLDKKKLMEAEIAGETFTPGCSLNPIVSCGDIMESDQAEAFGFPNPMLGLVMYGAVVAIGAAVLAGAHFRPWFWRSLLGGTFFGVAFCTWLMYQSLYNINALCLWCCLAWVATLTMFWATLVHTVRHRLVPAPEGLRNALLEFPWVFPAAHVGIIGMLILTKWWDFWLG